MRRDESEQALRESLEKQTKRIEKASDERRTVLAQTVYLGTLSVMLVLPVVGGAYVGQWLDSRLKGYSVSWTINLLVLGVIFGALNVYLFIKERE